MREIIIRFDAEVDGAAETAGTVPSQDEVRGTVGVLGSTQPRLEFNGWLQLLGHLEKLSAGAASDVAVE